jgi:hypothetical protein
LKQSLPGRLEITKGHLYNRCPLLYAIRRN